ncbi:MAG: PHP domain-containing protein [bacterium]
MEYEDGYADLHLHSNRSDGYLSPRELIDKCVGHGFKAIAIVDHDDISAYQEISGYGRTRDIEVITGVELSVCFRNDDIHILGYGFDCYDSDLIGYLDLFKEERIKRARKIVENLAKLGMPISFEAVLKKAGTGSIGRPHIAKVLVDEKYVHHFQEAFNRYLGDGKPAHFDKYQIDLSTAVRLIAKAGGVSVLAHPGLRLTFQHAEEIIKYGLDGIEVIHPRHNLESMRTFKDFAQQNGLLETGGSDYHGGDRGDMVLGKYKIPYDAVIRIKERIATLGISIDKDRLG